MVLQHSSPTFLLALLINLHYSSFTHIAAQSLVAQMTVSLVIPCLKIHGITFPTTQLLHPPKRMAIKILLFNNDNINLCGLTRELFSLQQDLFHILVISKSTKL